MRDQWFDFILLIEMFMNLLTRCTERKKAFNMTGECCFVWGPDIVAWYGRSAPDIVGLILLVTFQL